MYNSYLHKQLGPYIFGQISQNEIQMKKLKCTLSVAFQL